MSAAEPVSPDEGGGVEAEQKARGHEARWQKGPDSSRPLGLLLPQGPFSDTAAETQVNGGEGSAPYRSILWRNEKAKKSGRNSDVFL